MLNDFLNLIFPRLCSACSNVLLKNESTLCLMCQFTLPKTNYHFDIENPVFQVFWGRVEVKMAASYYHFSQRSRVQHLLHQLKYKGVKDVGLLVGDLYGKELIQSENFLHIDFVVPIPLHKKKLKKRGYNQSEYFARGLASSMEIAMNHTDLIRLNDSSTQTRKSRIQRWDNVAEIFDLKENSKLKGKSILLVDDVITTGATMEAAIQVLNKNECKVWVATIASA